MKKIILCVAFLLTMVNVSYAQVSSYAFLQSSGAYTPITSGATLASFTASSNGTTRMDDEIYNIPNGTIPFGFLFNGIAYTGCNVSSNGFITFGTTAPTTGTYEPISATTAYSGAVSAFGRDLEGGFVFTANRAVGSADLLNVSNVGSIQVGDFLDGNGIATGSTVTSIIGTTITMSAVATSTGTAGSIRVGGPSSNIQYITEGVAPNRVFVIQYSNFKRFGTTLTTVQHMVLNFQIRLSETTNDVKIVYGNCSPGLTTFTTINQVGLRGADANFATSVNNRLNGKGVNDDWLNSAPGTVNTSGMLFNNVTPANVISSGLIYSWSIPSCVAPSSIVSSSITTNTATISWTAPSPLPSAGYEYVITTTNTLPTGSGTAVTGTSVNISSLIDSALYYIFVRSNCGAGFSSWVGPVAFSTLCNATNVPYSQDFESVTAPALPQCTSVVNAGSGNTWNTDFNPGSGFDTNVLNYAYNSTNPANTWFFTRGINLTAGTSYRITYNYGSSSTTYIESLKVAYGTSNTVASMTNPLADHPAINQGTIQFNQVDFTPTATGIYYFGFQAYSITDQAYLYVDNITVDLGPSCSEPFGLTAANVTSSSAALSWNPAVGAVNYQYILDQVATDPTGAGTNISVVNYNATGLSPNTTYYFHVRTNCGASFTPWSTYSFSTYFTPPSNDTCATAVPLNVGGTFASQVVTGTVLGGTNTNGIVPSCQSAVSADVWYSIVVPASGTLTIETQEDASNSITDSVLAAFSGTCGALTSLGCDDDAGSGAMSLLSLTGLTGGSTIYVGVWKYGTSLPTATANTFKVSAYDATLGTESFDLNGFASYPNPVVDFLNLSYTKNITKVAVHNLVGQEIMNKTINATQSKIDMSNLSNGTYLVKVTVDGLEKTLKVLKQ
jgi:hypothetical protein